MIGSLMMCMSVVMLLIGMLAGIAMGIQQDFALAPAHAHLNLIGGVLLFLFGLYYRLFPAAGTMTLAKVQGWLHMVGAILFPAGIAVALLKGPAFEGSADRGIADRRCGDSPVCRGRVSDLAGLNPLGDAARPHLQPHPWHSASQRFAAPAAHTTHEKICRNH